MATKTATRNKRKTDSTRKSTKSTTTHSTKKSTNAATSVKKRITTTPKKRATTKYSTASANEVKKEMRKFKKGTAKSGKGETPVKSRKQAIAIGLSKARAKGAKVPKKRA